MLYLLDLFCNSTNPGVREKTAELFAKMMADKLLGPRVRIILSKFLPGIFMDAMRDSSQTAAHMFEGAGYCKFAGKNMETVFEAVNKEAHYYILAAV